MDKARDGVAIAAAADAASTVGVHLLQPDQKATGPADQAAPGPGGVLLGAGLACLRVAVAVLVGYSFAATAWRVRHDPRDLTFVAASALLLAELFVCLRRAERLAPESPTGERRRVQAAVWALSTVLSCAFAYRVAGVMPPALAVLVWCMTAFVVLAGFFALVLCEDCQYQALHNADAVRDRKPSAKVIPADELV